MLGRIFKIIFTSAGVLLISINASKADKCDAALEQHTKVMNMSELKLDWLMEKRKQTKMGLEWHKLTCDIAKHNRDHSFLWLTVVEEDEEACSKKRLAKALKCDSTCVKRFLESDEKGVKRDCGLYEDKKAAEEARSKQ